jgi:hypothetical protein
MSKTKYPNKIDTPAELPIVRDNIFEIGSDAINSLRSAIIQIEKTLGVNPQGSVGLTVGERISQSLDLSGNIKREALDRAGIVSGPIFDDQISDVAAIKEHKLKLNIPTQILQSEISSLASVIDEIQSQIEQISSKLSAHLSLDASNRHSAKSISTTSIEATTSSTGVKSFSASNVQSALDSIFSSHINYDGTNISEINNSHTANQIFYDNTNTPDILSSNVQDAITDVANFLQLEVINHQDLLHSNGFANSSYIKDKDDSSYGTIILSSSTSSVFKNLGEKSYFEIILDSPILKPGLTVGLGDVVELEINSIKKEFQIYKVNYDAFEENITGFLLFGIISSNDIGISTRVFLRRYRSYNSLGLLGNNREMYGLSSSSLVQIMNPDSVFIQTEKINPNEISISNRYFDLKINGTLYSFDVYNSVITKQSIDSIIKAINETVDSLALPILAYRVNKQSGGSEIVIAGNLSSLDDGSFSLEVVRVDGAIDSLGLASYEDKVVYGQPGSSYYISGKKYNGLLKKFDLSGFSLQSGSRNISAAALGISFFDYGIKKGDIVNIIDSFYSSYEITEVTSSYISVSSRQLPSGFNTSTSGTSRIIIYESTVDLSNSEFLKIGVISGSSVGSSLFELFLDQNRNLNSNLILEQESGIYLDKSIYEIVDYKNLFNLESFEINFENSEDSGETCVYVWLDQNPDKKKVVGNNNYITLKSNIKNFECTIYIHDISSLYNYGTDAGGSFTKSIYLAPKINKENNLIISNVHYSNTLGKISGGVNGSLFIPKLNFGNLDEKDISTALRYSLNQLPISELRSSGVIHGLKVSDILNPDGYSSGQYLVSIDSGICYIKGKRFEILGVENYDSGVDAAVYDKVYVGIDTDGNFVFSGPDPSCSYPWAEEEILLLGTIENNDSSYRIIDQRLFINNIDLKLLNSITVSPQPGMGHFTNINDAINYAKRFSEIFPNTGTPEVHLKSGLHKIIITDSTNLSLLSWFAALDTPGSGERISYFNNIIKNGLFLDFPISIRGEGDSSVVEIIYKLTASDGEYNLTNGIMVVGDGFNTSGSSASYFHNRFNYGTINISNLYLKETGLVGIDLVNNNGTNNLTFKLNIENITFERLETSTSSKEVFILPDLSGPFFYEVDDNTSSKGNIFINNCRLLNSGRVYFAQSPLSSPMRYKNITISNCHTLSSEGIVRPSLSDDVLFPANSMVWLIANITPNYIYSDRVANNIIVGGNATVSGNVISDNYYFASAKQYHKIYWAHLSQIPYNPGTSSTYFTAADSFVYDPGVPGSYRSSTRINQTTVSGSIITPSVNVPSSDYLSIPVDILNNQKLKSIDIHTIGSSAATVEVSLIRYDFSSGIVTVISATPLSKTGSLYTLNYVYQPTSTYSFVLFIKNTHTSSQAIDRVKLTFESNNLFELIGIS